MLSWTSYLTLYGPAVYPSGHLFETIFPTRKAIILYRTQSIMEGDMSGGMWVSWSYGISSQEADKK